VRQQTGHRSPKTNNECNVGKEETDVSELVVIGYRRKFAAEEVRLQLLKMQREYLIDVEDAIVAVKEPNGHIKLNQVYSPAVSGVLGDSFWGLLVDALFLSPWLGAVFGAAPGTLCGVLAEVGIDDTFMTALADTLQPSSSALFVLVRQATPERELAELQSTGGKLLKTSLRHEKAELLQAALDAIIIPPPPGSEAAAGKKTWQRCEHDDDRSTPRKSPPGRGNGIPVGSAWILP
jgi:uncharacterized membrane protein